MSPWSAVCWPGNDGWPLRQLVEMAWFIFSCLSLMASFLSSVRDATFKVVRQWLFCCLSADDQCVPRSQHKGGEGEGWKWEGKPGKPQGWGVNATFNFLFQSLITAVNSRSMLSSIYFTYLQTRSCFMILSGEVYYSPLYFEMTNIKYIQLH